MTTSETTPASNPTFFTDVKNYFNDIDWKGYRDTTEKVAAVATLVIAGFVLLCLNSSFFCLGVCLGFIWYASVLDMKKDGIEICKKIGQLPVWQQVGIGIAATVGVYFSLAPASAIISTAYAAYWAAHLRDFGRPETLLETLLVSENAG